jgi:hypothetical protein
MLPDSYRVSNSHPMPVCAASATVKIPDSYRVSERYWIAIIKKQRHLARPPQRSGQRE